MGLPPRDYPSFRAAAQEAAISRLYAGIHFRAAIEHGIEPGHCVGAHMLALPMFALHDALVAHISPLGLPAYRDAPYVAHITLVYSPASTTLQRAKDLIIQMNFGSGFRAEAVPLMGRVGPRVGGKWKLIERIPLAAEWDILSPDRDAVRHSVACTVEAERSYVVHSSAITRDELCSSYTSGCCVCHYPARTCTFNVCPDANASNAARKPAKST